VDGRPDDARRLSVNAARARRTLQFLGGVGTVTGSKFLVRARESAVLVDCGLFQGLRETRVRNWDDPPFDPSALDAIVLTHAHVDHCGFLPRLVAAGYRGPVYATPSTLELVRVVLPDCGHLQEEEAEYANRKGFSRHEPALPLFTEDDAWRALELLLPVPFHTDVEVAPDVTIRLARAGHILGAASACLTLTGGPTVGFSGDLGRPNHPFLVAPDPPGAVDWLLVESTYGDRRHPDASGSEALAAVIHRTVDRGGSVLIPAFAVDRTEVVLHQLACLADAGRLPAGVPVYVDSPMALSALKVYRDAIARADPDVRAEAAGRQDVFSVPGLTEVRDVETSKALNSPAAPSIVISASGMGTGGRVVHHLAHWLPDARNTVVLVGYQAAGTRGRQLLDGSTELKMLGRYIRVRAEVVDLPAFSVHADSAELLDWVTSAAAEPSGVYVVHGEPRASAALARSIGDTLDWTAVVPYPDERVSLDPQP
jgi:metallo-beta-lactamase family protein